MIIELDRLIDKTLNWSRLVGVEIISPLHTRVVCTSFSGNKLYIGEWEINKETGATSVIVVSNEDRALQQLKLFGYDIVVTANTVITYSNVTKHKAMGLIQAGYSYINRFENNYKVDDVFVQSFLEIGELEALIAQKKGRVELNEIVEN